jgi:threonine aldolase
MFGGGWRQAGILAAAGMYAITHNWGPTMAEVHANAQFLGDELRKMGFTVNKSCMCTAARWF